MGLGDLSIHKNACSRINQVWILSQQKLLMLEALLLPFVQLVVVGGLIKINLQTVKNGFKD